IKPTEAIVKNGLSHGTHMAYVAFIARKSPIGLIISRPVPMLAFPPRAQLFNNMSARTQDRNCFLYGIGLKKTCIPWAVLL
ncbi:MAG TPA: hypothetical protein VJK29_23320, partial [Terriglobales bacterium]|nr:hypothetical protein [Terriglobales bacterium]